MKSELKIIDFTLLKKYIGRLDPSLPLELEILEHYSYYTTDKLNTIKTFTNSLLSKRYYKKDNYPYNEINTFYSSKQYLNVVIKILVLIDYIITKEIGCSFENVVFNKIIENKDKLLVEMRIELG